MYEVKIDVPLYSPTNEHKFVAYVPDMEDDSPQGFGATEKDALLDLIDHLTPEDALIEAAHKYGEMVKAEWVAMLTRIGGRTDFEKDLAARSFKSGFEYAVQLLLDR